MSTRPRVGISQCLLGAPVRYDGGHKRQDALIALGEVVEWVPVCPEVEVGMGTPREPIHLVAVADGVPSGQPRIRLLGVESRQDWTEEMASFARRRAEELARQRICGFVLKRSSPSCGPGGVTITGSTDIPAGRGLFAQAVMEVLPGLPIEDEESLRDSRILDEFLAEIRRRALCSLAKE